MPIVGTYINLLSQNLVNEICAYQVFGYNNCDFTITETDSTTMQVPTGTVTAVVISYLTLNLSYTIGSVGVRHDDFC